MKITIQVRFDDQQPGANLRIQVLAYPKASRATPAEAKVVAEGETKANGIWLYDPGELDARRLVALLIIDPKTDAVLKQTRPVPLGRIKEAVRLTVSREPPLEGPDTDDIGAHDRPAGDDIEADPDAAQPPAPDQGGPRRRRYTQILEGRLARSDSIKADEDAVTRARNDQRLAQRRKGGDFARRLLGRKPLGLRPAGHFVPQDSDADDREAEVIKGAEARFKTPRGRGITLRPGPLADSLGKAGGAVPADRIEALVADLLPGNRAAAKSDPLSICKALKAAAAAQALLGGEDPPAASPAPLAGPAEPDPRDPLDRILDQMFASAASPSGRPSLSDVEAGLKVDVPSGPADTTAFYDFHNLQIAWADTWTGLVDDSVAGDVKELYDRVVRTAGGALNEAALAAELAELDDLNEMLDSLADVASALDSAITSDSQLAAWIPEIAEKWADLTPYDREKLGFLYDVHIYVEANHSYRRLNPNTWQYQDYPQTAKLDGIAKFEDYPEDWIPNDLSVHSAWQTGWATTEAAAILAGIKPSQGARIGRVDDLITGLKRKIAAPYQFDVFLPGSYNFGLLTTYRQKWTPITYQPGDLAGTITLAPNEKRKYTVSRKTASKTASSSATSTLDRTTSESGTTARSEGEIMRRTQSAMSAATNAEVGFDFGVKFTGGGAFGYDQGAESAQTKSDLREETRKSAQEFRDERKTEIATELTGETTASEEREISNPNSELTVTYLFYELQRRFRVNERLHHLRPVVLVAFAVPPPHMIDESWLLKHEWILHKVLLDTSLHGTLRLLSQDFAGDELATEIFEEQWKTQIALVGRLADQMEGHADLRGMARGAIQSAAAAARAAAEAERSGTTWQDVGLVASGGVGVLLADRLFKKLTDDNDPEAPSTADSAQQALDWANADYEAAQGALRRGVSALEAATEKYVSAVRDRLNRRVEIDKLILHIKTNILHYMQAIWLHEHADQRYMRLYDKSVVWPGFSGPAKFVPSVAVGRPHVPPGAGLGSRLAPQGTITLPPPEFRQRRQLHEVADLSRILGFKGNYAIFGLREANALTTTMAQDFLDSAFGLLDPDGDGNLPTAEEAMELARCAWDQPNITEDDRREITEWLVTTLEAAHRASQEIVVPSGELFIEGLPGSHPLLEDFKLAHRAHDMAKAAAEARMAELEVLRRAERLRQGDLTDPDVDKRIEVGPGVGAVHVDIGDG